MFFFTPSQVAANEAPRSARLPHRRHGGDGQRQARRRATVRVRRDRHREDHPGGLPRAPAGPLPRRQGRRRAGHARRATACSARARCSPSTTRTTCRRKPKPRRRSAHKRAEDVGDNDPRARPVRARLGARRFAGAGHAAARRRRARQPRLDGARAPRGAGPVRCSSPSPSAASCTPSSRTTSPSSTSRSTPTRRCRSPTASPAPGAATRARCCSGADARRLDGRGHGLQPPPPRGDGRARARRAGHRQRRLPRLHAVHVESLRPPVPGAGRRARPEPAAAGPRAW